MGVFALAGCAAEAEAPVEEAPAVEAEAANFSVTPGVYSRTGSEGQKVVTTITADNTFVTTTDGETTGEGTVAIDGETICFDGQANEAEEDCWVNGPMGEDGLFTSTAPDGESYEIQMTPPEAEAEAE